MMGMQRPSRRRTLSGLKGFSNRALSLTHHTRRGKSNNKEREQARRGYFPRSPERPAATGESEEDGTADSSSSRLSSTHGGLQSPPAAAGVADLSIPSLSKNANDGKEVDTVVLSSSPSRAPHDKPLPFRFISEVPDDLSQSEQSSSSTLLESPRSRSQQAASPARSTPGGECRDGGGGDDPRDVEITELRWRLRRAEEEAEAHRRENAELRRRLVAAEARADQLHRASGKETPSSVPADDAGAADADAADSGTHPSGGPANGAVEEEEAIARQPTTPAPSMCETDAEQSFSLAGASASSVAKVAAPVVSVAEAAVGTDQRQKVVHAVEYVDSVLKRIVALTSAEDDAAEDTSLNAQDDATDGEGTFDPPKMVTVPSNSNLVDLAAEAEQDNDDGSTKECDQLPKVVSMVSPEVAPATQAGMNSIGSAKGNTELTTEEKVIETDRAAAAESVAESVRSVFTPSREELVLAELSLFGGSLGEQEPSASSGTTPRKTNRTAPSALAELSFLSASEGGRSVAASSRRGSETTAAVPDEEESWAPAGATRNAMDETASFATCSSSTYASCRGASSSVANASQVSGASSWQPAGDTRGLMMMSGDASLASGSLVSGGEGSSWKPVGATRGEIAADGGGHGFFIPVDFNDRDDEGGEQKTRENDEATASASGSWMPAGATGNLFQQDDDTASFASLSTWDTKSTMKSFVTGRGEGGQDYEDEYKSAVSGLTSGGSALFKQRSKAASRRGSNGGEKQSQETSAVVFELYRIQGLLRSVLEETDRSRAAEV